MWRPVLFLAVGAASILAARPRPSAVERHCFAQREDPALVQHGPYDGRFTFFRVSFQTLGGGSGRGYRVDRKWDHDTPRAERHLMKIMREITSIQPQMECGEIYSFGDPESFKYPIAYVSEPGFWTMSEQELQGIRDYVNKGGFIIFDDFIHQHWYNFEERWHEAFPNLQLVELDATHPIFNAFYQIQSLEGFTHPYFDRPQSHFFGAFEDNDPKKRLVIIANYDSDLGDYMEWSDESFLPIALSNEAYKLMVNYVVYGMTH